MDSRDSAIFPAEEEAREQEEKEEKTERAKTFWPRTLWNLFEICSSYSARRAARFGFRNPGEDNNKLIRRFYGPLEPKLLRRDDMARVCDSRAQISSTFPHLSFSLSLTLTLPLSRQIGRLIPLFDADKLDLTWNELTRHLVAYEWIKLQKRDRIRRIDEFEWREGVKRATKLTS